MGILDIIKSLILPPEKTVVPVVEKPVEKEMVDPPIVIDNPPPKDYKTVRPMVIDLSHHNTIGSFAEVKKAGIVGTILKATQGVSYTDSKFSVNRNSALDNGLIIGAYHFGDGSNVVSQVDRFLKVVNYDGKTLLALDFEKNPTGSTMGLEQAREFLRLVAEKTGQKPVLYGGALIKQKLGVKKKDVFFGGHRLWLSQYGPRAVVPAAWDNYWLWQFTDGAVGPQPHRINGIVGHVDINSFPGTADQLRKEWVM